MKYVLLGIVGAILWDLAKLGFRFFAAGFFTDK
jgi:hypothetical protein